MSDTATTTATTTTTDAGATAAQAQTPTDWTASLPAELKGYVQTKGFKDPGAVVESYRGLEKLHGVPAERIIKLPDSFDGPEGRAIYEKLGAPKEAKDYKIEFPKEHGGEELSNWPREVAYKNGMSHRQVEAFVNGWNERATKGLSEAKEQRESQVKAAQANLEKEWGQAMEQNKNIADQAALKFGMGEKEVAALGAALGPDKAMQLLYKLGRSTGEAEFVVGSKGAIPTPDSAIQQINALSTDETFRKRFASGDVDAVRQWNKLHEQAYGRGVLAQQ